MSDFKKLNLRKGTELHISTSHEDTLIYAIFQTYTDATSIATGLFITSSEAIQIAAMLLEYAVVVEKRNEKKEAA